ncbi:MAG: metalloregulator ArsR/SmtB family transcription factor [Verrucomicrobiota bacterium]
MEYTHLFRQLTDATRLRILVTLWNGPLCVCHLVEILDEPQAKISKQLSQLRRAGLLQVKRVRNWSVYRLAEPRKELVNTVIGGISTDIASEPQLVHDEERRVILIERLAKNPGCCPLPAESLQQHL